MEALIGTGLFVVMAGIGGIAGLFITANIATKRGERLSGGAGVAGIVIGAFLGLIAAVFVGLALIVSTALMG